MFNKDNIIEAIDRVIFTQEKTEITEFTWNRTIDNAGILEKTLPWIYMWSIVTIILIKQDIRNVGLNLTDNAVNRICHAEK